MAGDLLSGLKGQSFYLHDMKRHQSVTLTDIIIRLGGVCGSRGKALLEKAIHSNEKYQSSVLANARSWGVKVYNVDAGVLRSPYLKVEDSSRRFRPYYAQTLNFPVMSFSGKFSPFEPPIPLFSGKSKEEDASKDNFRKKEEATSGCHKLQAPLTASATPRGPTKKSSGYCECCHTVYKDEYEVTEVEYLMLHVSAVRSEGEEKRGEWEEVRVGVPQKERFNPNMNSTRNL
ncbi:histone-lysine N-methyltransferase 2D-like protein [Labeo rohita]|uniref:Histone-lysine N-methyltransferase 2D-like protein n=1 Tax=Labeo rohita TaxID=84645 RepID=A0A498NLN1_LABRO|nr:histone-lysine N-methyltransferase 2D-like protein [Labeo rohita]